jgi:hypothetical protein
MSTEMTIALIGVCGTLAGVFTGAWTTRKQLSLSYDTLTLEVFQKRMDKLEAVFHDISSMSIDLADPKLTPDQIRSRAIDMFVKQVTAFKPCMHYFPKQLEDDLTGLHGDINRCIAETKLGGPPDEDRYRRVCAAIPVCQKRMLDGIPEELRALQTRISRLTTEHD